MNLVDKNINIARTLPSVFYTDDKIFEQSKSIFEESIQIMFSQSELINSNNLFVDLAKVYFGRH